MENPFVVFLDPTRDVEGWKCPVELPVGWKVDGSLGDPTKDMCDFLLLVLNDCEKVGTLVHTNVDRARPLLVLKHERSTENAQPEADRKLQAFGKPRVLASFSHQPHNQKFNRIRRLVKRELTAQQFVDAFASEDEAGALVDLASICQLALLSPALQGSPKWANEVAPRMLAALEVIPEAIGDRFVDLLDSEGDPLWHERLELITTRASEIQAS